MKTTTLALVLGLGLMGSVWAQDGGYLELPLKGKLGEDITSSGVDKALKGAKDAGIKNIVFTVDCAGGDQLVAKELVNILSRYDKDFAFFAVVHEALGTGVVFIVRADKIFVKAGAKIGGVKLDVKKTEQETGVGADVILANVALNAGVQAKLRGRAPELVRAMIDPTEPVMAWKNKEGKVQFGRLLPEGTPKDAVLLEHKAGLLTLSDEQAVALGFAQKLEGGVEDLGKALGINGWASKGNATATLTEAATADKKTTQEAEKSDRQKFLIDQNKKRREATKAGIERCMEVAHEWNPKLGTYSTYKDWGGYWDGSGGDSGRLTPEARQKWQDRTSVTVSYLTKARSGVAQMKSLDKEAKTMGQEPTYPEGKLEAMYEDLGLTIAMLEREWGKRFQDNK